jgi:hypothetical protein
MSFANEEETNDERRNEGSWDAEAGVPQGPTQGSGLAEAGPG